MNSSHLSNQLENIKGLHPDLAKAALAVYTEPEVQEAMKVLGKYGLGITLPHGHDEQDKLIPLPYDEMQSEAQQQVSFIKKHQINPVAVIVGWRAGPNGEIDFTSECTWLHSCTGVHR